MRNSLFGDYPNLLILVNFWENVETYPCRDVSTFVDLGRFVVNCGSFTFSGMFSHLLILVFLKYVNSGI